MILSIEKWLADVSSRVVELPLARKQRFMQQYQLPASDAQTFVWDAPLGNYFEGIAKQSKNPKAVANWVINNLRAKLTEANETLAAQQSALGLEREDLSLLTLSDLKFKPEAIAELAALVQENCFYHLEAPIERVTGWDTPYPHAFEWDYFPGPKRVVEAMRRAMEA